MKVRYFFIIGVTVIVSYLEGNSQVYFNKTYDNNSEPNASTAIVEAWGGGYLIAGVSDTVNARHLFIVKVDNLGNLLWTKKYGKDGYNFSPGLSGSLIRTFDGGYAIGGNIMDYDDSVNTSDVLLVKLDVNGDTIWTKIYGGVYWDAARIVQQTSDSGYVLIGDTDTSGNADDDFYIIKTDSLGNIEWEQNHGGNGYQVALSGQQTLDGGYIMSGLSGIPPSIHRIIKVDNLGNFQWNKTYSGEGGCYIIQSPDSGYVLTGKKDVGGLLGDQGVIRKTDKNGNQDWEKTFGESLTMEWFDSRAVLLPNEDIAVAGTKVPGAGTPMGWLFKVNSSGDSLWDRTYITTPTITNQFFDIIVLQNEGFVMCGTGWGVNADVWAVKVDSIGCEIPNCDIGIDEYNDKGMDIIVYPNPSDGKFTFEILNKEHRMSNTEVLIFDVMGQSVGTWKLVAGKTQVEISNLPKGLYLWQINTARGKVIINR